MNEVAQGLVNTEAAVGIIPTGSGNGLARHLGIPLNLPGAINLLRNARPVSVDYGILNGTPFFCTAGIGFDAMIGHEFSLLGKRGFSSYLRIILTRFLSYTPQEYKIRINDSEITKVLFLVTFANSSQYGNRASIAPQANIMDGFMDVTMLSPFPFYKALDIGIRLLTKNIDSSKYVEIVKCKEVSVERESPGYVHFDGEPMITGRQVDVKIIPGGLNVLV
ncbi:Diacylglycerol kinase [subsurface metagenome]